MRRRVADFCDWADGGTMLGLVLEGATTPWSWASLPGLPALWARRRDSVHGDNVLSQLFAREDWAPIYEVHDVVTRERWMTTLRRPEPRKP